MEKLRKFNLEDDYLEIKESLEYPTLSLTDDNGKVWVKEYENYIIMTLNVTSTTEETFLFTDYGDLPFASYYIIDNEILIEGRENGFTSYHFDTLGEHTIKAYFNDNTSYECVYMFQYSEDLTSVDLSHFDTSNVTSMTSMFRGCEILTSITFGDKFDTSKVTNMSYMFSNCYNLTSLDLSSFNTTNVTDMTQMFVECGLTSLDLSNFDTSKVTNMSYMFSYCYNLPSLDLSGWDISKVEYGDCAFDGVLNDDAVIGVDTTLDIFNCGPV